MHLSEYLLRWTGDASYDDYWERNLYNGSLAQQHPESGMVTYFLPLRSGSAKKWGTPTEDFWCCQGTLLQAHTVYANHIFYEEGEDLVLSQYIPCQLDWNRNETRISLTLTEDPHLDAHHRPCSQSYQLKITCPQPEAFTIKFRLPWWLSASPEVKVNGERQAIVGDPSTYVSIPRVWHHDTLQITLPQGLSVSRLPDSPDTVAFMEGPVVLAAVLGDRSGQTRAVETVDEKTLYCKKDEPTTVLVPDNERDSSRWRTGYRTQGQRQNIRFIPLYEIQDECYAVYFPLQEP
jgi:uncharacterized protein